MKKTIAALIVIALSVGIIFTLAACLNTDSDKDGYTFTDATGRSVTVPENPENVVSLQGSFAETWLLAGGTLAGVTSDVYEDLGLDVQGAEIVGTVKEPNTEILLSLNPGFVIMSADIAGHKDVAKLLDRLSVPYAYFKQETFDDYLSMLEVFTSLTGKSENYEKYGTSLKTRIDDVIARANSADEKLEVLFVRARSQGVSAKATDHMVCTMLEEFGVTNIAAKHPSLLENLSIEEIVKQDPDVILVTFMGDEDKAKEYLVKAWESNPAWSGLTAVKQHGYVFLQKDLFHFKPNARWADAYETLYEILFQ